MGAVLLVGTTEAGLGQQLEAWSAWAMLADGVFLILRRQRRA